MRGPVLWAASILAFAVVGNPTNALYAYAPDALVVEATPPPLPEIIKDPADADAVLDAFEVSFGVQAADDPFPSDRKDLLRVYRTERVMDRHWRSLDSECDANAVFALMYLTTTRGIRYHIEHQYFADNDYLSIITVSFAYMYLTAYDAWERGDASGSPAPWSKAFDYAKSGESSIMDDELLGMNAHINYDLALAIAALGTVGPDGQSRKPDMDRVNHVLAAVTDDVAYEISRYYGPTPPTGEPDRDSSTNVSAETQAVLEVIYAWRENAWHQAETHESLSGAARDAHEAEMEQTSGAAADGFKSPKAESPSAERLAYCSANP